MFNALKVTRRQSNSPTGGHLQRVTARLRVFRSDLRDDPRWVVMFVLGRIVGLRRALRALRALHSPSNPGSSQSAIFDPVSVADVVTSLEQDGLCVGPQLPAPIVAELIEFAQRTTCYGNISREQAFLPRDHRGAETRYGTAILVGHYLEKIENCPVIRDIQNDPLLQEIAGRYLKSKPIIISSRMWWSFPSDRAAEQILRLASQNMLHFDMNDWSSVKFYFYLTAVDKHSGPHVYIRGSHRTKRLRDQFTLFVGKSNAEILGFYGQQKVATICGPAGFGFVQDPFGFHMGTVVHKCPRLVLEIEFGVSPPTRRRYLGSLTEPTRDQLAR